MPTPNQTSRRVLFVDDDTSFLETMKELMAVFSEGRWEVLTAQSASQAFAVLQDQAVDLAVIDVQMPVMDGVQMLSLLNRGYPNLTKVALTGAANDNYRAACLSNGAELFLEKPKSRDELHSLYATLNELLKWGKPQGFRGVMRRVELAELIQLECEEGHSSVLEINSDGVAGRIFVHGGTLVHAIAGDKKGPEALRLLLSLRGGDFKLTAFAEAPEQTLSGSWEELLLRAGPTGVPKSEEVQPAPAKREIPAAPTPTAYPVTLPSAAGRPTVEEVLICSARGEVLYEWQCREPDMWVKFLELASQKSQRLAQGVALGEFDRLEILREQSRIVVLIAPDRGVMIRIKRERGGQADDQSASARHTGRLAIDDETKEQLSQWLRRAPSARGVLVRGIRFPDQTMMCDLDSRDFPVVALEQAVRSVADTFQVLTAHRLRPSCLTWIYNRAALHCARRPDGAILAAVALTKPGETDVAGLDALLSGFRALELPGG